MCILCDRLAPKCRHARLSGLEKYFLTIPSYRRERVNGGDRFFEAPSIDEAQLQQCQGSAQQEGPEVKGEHGSNRLTILRTGMNNPRTPALPPRELWKDVDP